MFVRMLITSLSLVSITTAAPPSLSDAEQAEALYLDGLRLVANDEHGAAAAFEAAASAYETLIKNGAYSAGAWFNLGNARLQRSDLGEAIVAYRRAERIDPTNTAIRANLIEARRRVEHRIEPDATDLSFKSVAGWRHVLGPSLRLWLGLSAWVVFWIVLAMRTLRPPTQESEGRRAASAVVLFGPLVIALVFGATIALDAAVARLNPVGVLTASEIVLRSGNGEGFGAVVEEPLHEGVEFTILERRPGWWRVELADGTEGWVAERDAEPI